MRKLTWILSLALIGLFALSCNNSTKDNKAKESEEQTKEVSGDNKEESFDEIINGNIPVLVDFYADWCKPCQAQAPIIDELKEEMGDKLVVFKVNVDVETEIADRYGIQSIPTLMIFKNGEILWKAVGLQEKSILTKAVSDSQ